MIRNSDYRDLAVFTIVQDEPEFIHPWANHYKKHVASAADIYVLVHPPTAPDGVPISSVDMPEWQRAQTLLTTQHGVVLIPVHHASAFDHKWLAETVRRFQAFLLQSYDWVLFAEIDEFVMPTPDSASTQRTLLDYVRALGPTPPPAVRATGFEIIQQDGEPALPPEKYNTGAHSSLTAGDLIANRDWWRPSAMYSKTLLGCTPIGWRVGFHRTESGANEIAAGQPASDLTLLHLHKVDFDLALGRLCRSRARKWSQFDIENRLGWQNRMETTAELRTFWQQDVDTGVAAEAARLLPVADGIKHALR